MIRLHTLRYYMWVAALFEYVRLVVTRPYEFAGPLDIAQGVAEVPYQYRVAVPWLLAHQPLVPFDVGLVLVDVASLVLVFYAVQGLLVHLRLDPGPAPLVPALVVLPIAAVLLFNPCGGVSIRFPYDLPGVAVFTWGLLLLARRQFGVFAAVFVLGTLNRETTLWLLLPLLRIEGARPWRTGGLLAAWGVIKLGLRLAYVENPGQPVHFTPLVNWTFLHAPVCACATVLGMAALGWSWHRARGDLATLFACATPFVAANVLVGSIAEPRIWTELVPLVFVGCVQSLRREAA